MVLGITAGLISAICLAKYYGFNKEFILDLAIYLIIFGLLGARLYDVLLNLNYYYQAPLEILKIWRGGLAIHGALIGGLVVVWLMTRNWEKFIKLVALIVPAVAIGQFIGRWGNYFNQELFGRPTNLPWGIPINLLNRPDNFISERFFHPTFLYESLGNLAIFLILLIFNIILIRKQKINLKNSYWLLAVYFISYSLLRFFLEFIRIDETPILLGLRFPQIASLVLIIGAILLLILKPHAQKIDQTRS